MALKGLFLVTMMALVTLAIMPMFLLPHHSVFRGNNRHQMMERDRWRVALVVGTRAEVVGLLPVALRLKELGASVTAINTNQQPDASGMFEDVPFDVVDIAECPPGAVLSGYGALAAHVLSGVNVHVQRLSPRVVMVHGDTVSAMAGAVAAFYSNIAVARFDAVNPRDLPVDEFHRLVAAVPSQMNFARSFRRVAMRMDGVPSDRLWDIGANDGTLIACDVIVAHLRGTDSNEPSPGPPATAVKGSKASASSAAAKNGGSKPNIVNEGRRADIVVILTVYGRMTLDRQMDMVRMQTALKGRTVDVVAFQNGRHVDVRHNVTKWQLAETWGGNDVVVTFVPSSVETGYYGRFLAPFLVDVKDHAYFWVFDDDVIFGNRYLANCMRVIDTGNLAVRNGRYMVGKHEGLGLVGEQGWKDKWQVTWDDDLSYDYGGHIWSGKVAWLRHVWRNVPPTVAQSEDFWISAVLRMKLNIGTKKPRCP
eukprot:CAMPEP_0173381060 /NCGR_PEP_ID=MMETSP1356-20130122/3557_1 /TAXON_ID=77927 ORGANISM="Hemiselmis virescens, Strain PCC157" /NCGR_SAMPLE_ID=MMETSP1356 /ASSEMBLY_ACC=CAM_ASM_000847 /LENGTH=478 /DNA_ID=CAMNT_0014334803 /DNA_START=222 /DNA_END=1655 /DNA_ORIENTATION=-